MTKLLIGIGCLVLIILGAIMFGLIIFNPPGPHFTCHRGIAAGLNQWILETTNGDWYPNIDGSSVKSLGVLLTDYIKGTNELRDYCYVPGLKSDDPQELILIYMKEPSKRTWHGDNRWLLREKRWVILNPRFSSPNDTYGVEWSECGEAIPPAEFPRRLKLTLKYLETNSRPNWQNVVKEHQEFLNSINK